MSQMLHPGPEAVSEGEGQLSFGKWAQACEAKAGSIPRQSRKHGEIPPPEKRRGWGRTGRAVPQPRSELTHTCIQLCKGGGNPSECGISVFPVTSIPLSSLAAKT